jgi:hypothetical protein
MAGLGFPETVPVQQPRDDQFIASVRDATDIVSVIAESVTLAPQRAGSEYVGRCPFHDDLNPSLRVYADRRSFKCWSCGEGGDCFSFVMKRENVGFHEAVVILAKRAGIIPPPRGRYNLGMSDEFPREFDDRQVLPVLLGALPTNVVESESIVPMGLEGERLIVGVLDSCEEEILEKVRFISNRDIKVVVVTQAAMSYAMQRYLAK